MLFFKKKKNCRATPFGPQEGGQPPHLAWGWFGHPKAKPSNFFAFHFAFGVAKPPTWATGLVRLPPRQNPQIFLLPVLPLRVVKPPPWATGVVWPPSRQNPQIFWLPVLPLRVVGHPMWPKSGGSATPKIIIIIIIIILKKSLKIKKILWPRVVF